MESIHSQYNTHTHTLSKQPISNHPSKNQRPSPAGQQGKPPPQNAPEARVELVLHATPNCNDDSVHYQEAKEAKEGRKEEKEGEGYFAVSANHLSNSNSTSLSAQFTAYHPSIHTCPLSNLDS